MTALVPDLPVVEGVIVEQTNAFRKDQGLAPVKPSKALLAAARAYAAYLAKSGRFSHTADGRQPHERTLAAGYRHCQVAENLAYNLDSRGFESRALATQMMAGWKKSPGHRRNMVLPHVTEIGVALAKAPGEHRYYAVQLFGRPDSQKYTFKVVNKSGERLRYTLSGNPKPVEIVARMTITHTLCTPVNVSFERPAGTLGSAEPIGDLRPGAGDVVTLFKSGTVVRVRKEKDGKAAAETARR